MTPEDLGRYGLIVGIVFLMGGLIYVFGSVLVPSPSPDPGSDASRQGTMEEVVGSPLPAFTHRDWSGSVPKTLHGRRTLQEYYSRREYPGAPPIIPHPTDESATCMSCHAKGGYVKKYESFAPPTPHPELEACRQCHVPRTTDDKRVDNVWKSVRPPRMGRSALPGAPPPIPHSTFMRRDCLTCHAGPSAVDAIRTDHPERSYCTQCHVSRKDNRFRGRTVDGDE